MSNLEKMVVINGIRYATDNIPQDTLMVDYLREYLNLTGTRWSCRQAQCRACVVIVDHEDGTSETVFTCINSVDFFNGKKIRTVEGQTQNSDILSFDALSALQKEFLLNYSFQCSYCTPGFINEATVLLESLKRHPVPKDQVRSVITTALDTHLCRCTGYVRYYEAVEKIIHSTPGLVSNSQ